MSGKCSDIGGSSVSLKDEFLNLARKRHQSAHNPLGNITTSELQSHVNTSVVCGISIDVLSTAIGKSIQKITKSIDFEKKVNKLNIIFRFLNEKGNGTYVERRDSNGKVIKRYRNLDDAIIGASGRSADDFLIVRDLQSVPTALI